jgi:hypothetical protein
LEQMLRRISKSLAAKLKALWRKTRRPVSRRGYVDLRR